MIIKRTCTIGFVQLLVRSALLFVALLLSALCRAQPVDNGAEPEGAAYLNYIKPLPQSLSTDREKALLGQQLFHDPDLASGRASCSTCHALENWGADGLEKSINIRGGFDDMNTPTVFNAVFSTRLMWNGSAKNLEDQVNQVMENERHMGAGWPVALQYVSSQKNYQAQFTKLYQGVIDKRTVSDALVEYERTLITPNAPFDRYLNGDDSAINDHQKQGFKLFMDYGCIACHQGINVGGNMFARFGVFVEPERTAVSVSGFDLGRFNVTGNESDRYFIRVPSLRNVEKTAPYFHNGGAATLEDAVTAMGYYQLGRSIESAEVELIVEFLKSLTGKSPELLQ